MRWKTICTLFVLRELAAFSRVFSLLCLNITFPSIELGHLGFWVRLLGNPLRPEISTVRQNPFSANPDEKTVSLHIRMRLFCLCWARRRASAARGALIGCRRASRSSGAERSCSNNAKCVTLFWLEKLILFKWLEHIDLSLKIAEL